MTRLGSLAFVLVVVGCGSNTEETGTAPVGSESTTLKTTCSLKLTDGDSCTTAGATCTARTDLCKGQTLFTCDGSTWTHSCKKKG